MDQNNESPKIVFEGEEFQSSNQSFGGSTPKIVGWVMQYSGGYIKNETQANYVLLGFVVLAIIVSLFFFLSGNSKSTPAEERVAREEMLKLHPDLR